MKKRIFLFLIFIPFFTTNLFSKKNIVYLDLDLVLNQSNAGKKFINEFDQFKKKTFDDIKKIETDLKKDESDIRAKKNILEGSEYNKLVNEFKIKVKEFNINRSEKIKNLDKTKIKGTNNFLSKIVPLLEEYSKNNEVSLIIQKKNILIGKKELDITNLILKKINQTVKTIEIK